ncbi:MAG TPA: HEAT repeat domain-containing protein [Chloroflexota bacterium]|jgi:HEAT repeat protein|nr:HEAT repeat domain-containing protein [Chloroflexota bacterium]
MMQDDQLNIELANERDAKEVFNEALRLVATGEPLREEHYLQLTHISGDRLGAFKLIWDDFGTAERLSILKRLKEHEANDLRMEFNEVYHLAMQDDDPELRLAGLNAVIEDKSGWLFGHLMKLLESDPDVRVRERAGRALAPFAQSIELGEWEEEDADELEALLMRLVRRQQEPIGVRGAALEAAGHLSTPEVAAEIDDAFQDDALRLDAIRAMGHSGEPRWLTRLLRVVEDDDPRVRLAVATAFGEIPDQSSVPALVDMLDDEEMDVRLAAIKSLGELGGDEAREGLVYAFDDKRPEVREAATLALAELDFYEDPLSL